MPSAGKTQADSFNERRNATHFGWKNKQEVDSVVGRVVPLQAVALSNNAYKKKQNNRE